MDAASASQADLGDCGGKVHDCPDLVVLSFLDSGLFAAPAWFASDANRPAHSGDLCHIRSRERCRRVGFFGLCFGAGFAVWSAGKGIFSVFFLRMVCLPRVFASPSTCAPPL